MTQQVTSVGDSLDLRAVSVVEGDFGIEEEHLEDPASDSVDT